MRMSLLFEGKPNNSLSFPPPASASSLVYSTIFIGLFSWEYLKKLELTMIFPSQNSLIFSIESSVDPLSITEDRGVF